MATIVQEDGTGKANSNSYLTEAELTTYATDRGLTLTGTAAVLLIQSMDYVELQPFRGYKASDAQALQWPRMNAYKDGYYIASDTIPEILKAAQAEVALTIDAGYNPLATRDRAVKREGVAGGAVDVEYMDNAEPAAWITAAEAKLKTLSPGYGLRVSRG